MQTVLTEVYRRWRWVERTDQPDAYVRRALANTVISWRRRRSWWERPTAPDALPAAPVSRPGPAPGPDVAEESAARDELWQPLQRLAPRARAVLVLRFYEDLDDAAIAEVLGMAPSTVRSTASRGLAALRTEMSTSGTGGVR